MFDTIPYISVALLIVFSLGHGFIGRKQSTGDNFFIGNRKADWFPLSIQPPTDYMQLTTHSGVVARTFQGNFMFVRVRIDRTYLTPANNDNMAWGQISQVLLNH